MSVDSNSFIFELEESLFFEKGQEVEEIRGISIEPEINIQSLDNYISIHGIIELQGEYQKVTVEEEEDEVLDFDQIQAKRFVESIREVNGLYVFTHKFPVDISVPPHRVRNLEDVTVQIESFDYDLLGEDCLKIAATVEIHGILQDEAYRPAEEDLETVEADQEQVGETFSFEIEHPEEALTRDEPQEQTKEIEDDPDRWKIKSQPLSEYFQSISESTEETEEESSDEDQDLEEIEVIENVEEVEELDWDDAKEPELADYIEDTTFSDTHRDKEMEKKEEVLAEAKEEEEEKAEDERTENVSILSEIFRGEEESHYVKMRLCIVQENDTIDTIAERFKISPLQLIKDNQLEADDEVNEGQLLYIPKK